MSAEEIRQSDWNGVYRDRQTDEFVLLDVRDDTVGHVDAFSGDEIEELDMAHFADCVREGNYDEVSKDALENPVQLVQKLLYEAANAVSGGGTKFHRFSATDVDFVLEAVNHTQDEGAHYLQEL